MKKILTLCVIHKGSQMLLGLKKRGFGKGLWNGFGGRIKKGEDIEVAALRELKEEVGIEALDIKKRAVFSFLGEKDHKTKKCGPTTNIGFLCC